MPIDGEIDYRSYTDEQLEQALGSIDRERYPRNYQALTEEIERRRSEAEAARVARGEALPVVHRVEFNADAGEYFRIWIVNLALTILTLGIYSAWAKVRKLRYFYGSTLLAGSAFGYHGDPRRILVGRIIAAVLVASYFTASRISPLALIIDVALLALATPWLVVRSRMFALRVTSWRGLRFDFSPDYRGAYASLLGWLIAGVASLGLLMPRATLERYRFIVTRSRYGATPFDCHPGVGRFYKTAFAAIGLAIVAAVLASIPAGLLGLAFGKGASPAKSAVTAIVTYVVVLSVVRGYTQARNLKEILDKTTLGPHRFGSTLHARPLIGLYLGNTLCILLTLGLYTPWAEIRLARYRLETIELEVQGSLDHFVAAATAPIPAAAGEEISTLFDIDFGF